MTAGPSKASRQNRYLLLRFYLLLALGLTATAALLDYGYSRYLHVAVDEEASLRTTLALIAQTLPNDTDPAGLAAHAEKLSIVAGRKVQLFASSRFAAAPPAGELLFGQAENGADVVWFRSPSTAGDVVLQLDMPPDHLGWSLASLVPVIFYCAIFVIVGFWLAPLIRDLNRLNASARRFAGDYRAPLKELDAVTHLTELAESMRLMSARIRQLIDTQQDLSNGLSHEIRTPLARMKFALAVAEGEGHASALAAELTPDIGAIDSLITAMLDYARLDQSTLKTKQITCSTTELFAPFTDEAQHNALITVAQSAESVDLVQCDPSLMTLAISNLVVNASRHAQAQIQLSCVRSKTGQTVLRVDDDGAGVAESDREKVFAAFSRPEAAASGTRPGFGLGLAIVARVAQMHGGSVRVIDAPLGGARFELGWPGSVT